MSYASSPPHYSNASFRQLVLPAPGIVGTVVGFQTREDPFQVLRIPEIVTHDEGGIRIRLYILLKVEFVLEQESIP